MADPNVLYATIVQTSGLIVGILGGFLTASVVSITAKRHDLEERVAELRVELEARGQRRAQAASSLAAHDRANEHRDIRRGRLPHASALRERDALLDEAAGAERGVAEAEDRVRSLEEQLARVGMPPTNLGWGLASLAFLTLTGVIVPLLFMPQDPEDYCWWNKLVVVGAFGLGLAAVLVYLWGLLRPTRLSRHRSWRG